MVKKCDVSFINKFTFFRKLLWCKKNKTLVLLIIFLPSCLDAWVYQEDVCSDVLLSVSDGTLTFRQQYNYHWRYLFVLSIFSFLLFCVCFTCSYDHSPFTTSLASKNINSQTGGKNPDAHSSTPPIQLCVRESERDREVRVCVWWIDRCSFKNHVPICLEFLHATSNPTIPSEQSPSVAGPQLCTEASHTVRRALRCRVPDGAAKSSS